MKKILAVLYALIITGFVGAQTPGGKVLLVYDEVNVNSDPYVGYFRQALFAEGLAFEEAVAGSMAGKDLAAYDTVLIYGMVQAFNMKSPIRDWLKTKPGLENKRVSLFVTANRWFLKNLFVQLTKLLDRQKADVVDAVSMATKDLDDSAKAVAVKAQVLRLK
jgi:hypothetical protein